jgi:hypothetical protein
VLFEPEARAFDRKMTSAARELGRKVRTIGGNVQLFARERWLLRPSENRLWLQTLSHKAIRLTFPVMYAALVVSSALLLDRPFYALVLAAQLIFYGAAAVAFAIPAARQRSRLLIAPYVICFLSWATILGIARYVTGRQGVRWEKTEVLEF